MTIHDRQGLKQAAASRLSEARFDPRLLILIHTGVSLGATLLITAINYILNQQIAGTGGLSGIGLRSVLTTIQSVLQLAVTVLLPFWEIGMVYSAVQIARSRSAVPSDLAQGLRRFGPVLRLNLLRTGIYCVAAIPCLYLSVGIFTMTPLSAPMLQILEPIWEQASGTTPVLDDATMEALIQTMIPVIFLFLGLFLLVTVPLMYRLRMADYVIMEDQKTGALAAMSTSWRMTRKRAFALFRLDLSFWWFYGLQLLLAALTYSDMILPALGVQLPISEDLVYFLFYGLYTLGTLVLYWHSGSHVQTTYAVAYDTLRYQAAIPTPKPEPKPADMPWDYNN